MDIDATLHSIGLNLEGRLSLDPTLSKRLKQPFITPRGLCKQEASTFGVWNRWPCILEGLTNERCEEVWDEREVSTSLHRTISHPREVWYYGLQNRIAALLSWSSRHLPRVATKEMFEGTSGRRVAWSDTARGWLVVPPSTASRSCIGRIVSRGIKWSSS
jgi:hypothetical protein